MEIPTDLGQAHLRIAHLSRDLATVVKFYRDGLGFALLYEFRDHDGFDAVMLGRKGAAYHLAFVHKVGHEVGQAPTDDNLLVFYLPDADEWSRAVARLEELGHQPVKGGRRVQTYGRWAVSLAGAAGTAHVTPSERQQGLVALHLVCSANARERRLGSKSQIPVNGEQS